MKWGVTNIISLLVKSLLCDLNPNLWGLIYLFFKLSYDMGYFSLILVYKCYKFGVASSISFVIMV